MWAVCGAPRSGTTAMLEAVAIWTPLTVRWDVCVEWRSRQRTGLREHFYEATPAAAAAAAPGEVVKILDPAVPTEPQRAVLMLRDPQAVAASCLRSGVLVHPADVAERVAAFRDRWGGRLDEVHVDELADQPTLFARLAAVGWPVVEPTCTLVTRGLRAPHSLRRQRATPRKETP